MRRVTRGVCGLQTYLYNPGLPCCVSSRAVIASDSHIPKGDVLGALMARPRDVLPSTDDRRGSSGPCRAAGRHPSHVTGEGVRIVVLEQVAGRAEHVGGRMAPASNRAVSRMIGTSGRASRS